MYQDHLTSGQLARELGISQQRIQQLRQKGKIKAIQTPFGYLYSPEEVIKAKQQWGIRRKGQ